MSHGSKAIIINTLERAVSNDINRAQTFKDAAISELARWMFGVYETNSELFPGWITEYAPGSLSPYQFSVIVNGLMPYPLNGSTSMLVTPGMAMMEDASYTPDQSPFRYVNDPGIAAIGTLNLTTAPGATRIDVIECALQESTLEQSNRDIFNPATGLFTPTLIDKVKAGRLQYRIREGAPGGGFPGVVAGWMPLAVASVPSAAASWDDVTLWDVRPLLSQSQKPPFLSRLQDVKSDVFWPTGAWNAGFTQLLTTGKVTNGIGGYNQSGLLGNHPTDSLWIDLANPANWAAGAVPIPNFPYYLWALMPYQLPGWRKYTGPTFSPRRPTGMAGVMAVSMVAPTSRGYPSLAIAPPTATGLGGSTQVGSIAACGWVDSGGIGTTFTSDGDTVYLDDSVMSNIIAPVTTAPANGSGTSSYNLVDNLYYPACARGIRFNLDRVYTFGGLATGVLYWAAYIVDSTTGNRIAMVAAGQEGLHINTSGQVVIRFDVPLLFNYALVGTRRIEVDMTSVWSTGPAGLVIEGSWIDRWKMTP